jgi:hypothetical protein
VESEEGSRQSGDIHRLLNRVREIQQTQNRLMRELDESIDATDQVLREAENRGSDSAR